MNQMQRFAIAAAVVALAVLGLSYVTGGRIGAPATTPSPSASYEASPVAFPSLPARNLPGARVAPAGEYGWEGGAGDSIAGMHRVVTDGAGAREATAMIFATGPDCFVEQEGRQLTQVSVAGLDGIFIERYEPAVPFNNDGDEITRAYALAVDDRTLCVYVTWHPTTTEEELRAALDILDTIQAQPIGPDRIRITLTLPEGWDTG